MKNPSSEWLAYQNFLKEDGSKHYQGLWRAFRAGYREAIFAADALITERNLGISSRLVIRAKAKELDI